ncbi:MAG: hypothetical protein AMXMBFR53_36800 [Gemmatimonadota bacterium]
MAKYWSYSTGRKGISRVRVYERSVSPVLYIEWTWEGERIQRALQDVAKHPVTDKKLAMQIAQDASRRLERDHNRAAHAAVFGAPSPDKTVAELLTELHKIRGKRWSRQHARDQESKRRWWTGKAGKLLVAGVTEAMVEALTADEAERRGWGAASLARYRRYMAEAMTFAVDKLKWLPPHHKLTALDIPKATGKSRAYSMDEIRRLLPALEAVDVRAGWIGHVAWQSGRRLGALRTFPTAGVDVRDGHTVLTFPGETDKARRTGEVVVVGKAHDLTVALLKTAGDHLLGDPPPTHETCIKVWLRGAEQAAGVPYVRGRGWHAIKRRYATETQGMVGRDRQSGTREDRLAQTYRQDELAPKMAVARQMADLLSDYGTTT